MIEIETTCNREYKDRLFKAIFGRNTEQSKKWRLEQVLELKKELLSVDAKN